MSFRRKDRDSLAWAVNELKETRRLLERIDAGVITKFSDSPRAAEEFAALRKAYLGGARSEHLHAKNLIVLAQSIDEGATTETIRSKTVDLLQLFGVQEITPAQVGEMNTQEMQLLFNEVGDSASESSAWVRFDESGPPTVIEKGRVSKFPTPAHPDESIGHVDDAPTSDSELESDRASTSPSELQHSMEVEGDDFAVEQSSPTQGEGESK